MLLKGIYFVRHVQPIHSWQEDSTRPLSEEEVIDSKKVVEARVNIKLDDCVCTSYTRSLDTMKECSEKHKLEIHTDYRYRERENENILFRIHGTALSSILNYLNRK